MPNVVLNSPRARFTVFKFVFCLSQAVYDVGDLVAQRNDGNNSKHLPGLVAVPECPGGVVEDCSVVVDPCVPLPASSEAPAVVEPPVTLAAVPDMSWYRLSNDRMRILADDIDVPLGSTAILPMPDVPRARIRKQMRKISQSAEDLRIDPEEILFCSLCFEEHPELPEDMDPDEPDAREKQWMLVHNVAFGFTLYVLEVYHRETCQACKTGKYSIYVLIRM
ncbi:hypothetical protein COOONC_23573 [Cooperia oncophora]